MAWDNKIPLDNLGNQIHTVSYYDKNNKNLTWIDNSTHKDELRFDKIYKNYNGASYAVFNNIHGLKRFMFMSDFSDAIPKITLGVLQGNFKFTKKGTKFGIKLV